MHDVSWNFYEHLLEQIGSRPIRVTYDEGSIEIMSPLPEHEKAKKIIARLVEALTEELDIPVVSYGSTTFCEIAKRKGLEPDESYYIRHELRMRDKKRLDLSSDLPPDLAIEIDIFSRSIAREPIYVALGVPELWRYDGQKLYCLHLAGHAYVEKKMSLAFPMLAPAKLLKFIRMLPKHSETTIIKSFRQWVRKQGWTKH